MEFLDGQFDLNFHKKNEGISSYKGLEGFLLPYWNLNEPLKEREVIIFITH
jgi:hypothetical protein